MDTRFVALFVAVICVVAANNSEGRRKLAESFVGNGYYFYDEEINRVTDASAQEELIEFLGAERVWDYCIQELKDNYPASSKGIDSGFHQTTIDSCLNGVQLDSTSSVERIIHNNDIGNLPRNTKEIILHCLRQKNFPLQVSSEMHDFPFKKMLLVSESIPRRYLRHKSRKRRVLVTASAPDPGFSPVNIAPSPIHQIPSSSPVRESADMEPPDPTPPLGINKPSELPINIPHFSSELDNNASNQKYILAALVASLVLGLVLTALLLFVCLKRKRRVEPNDGQRDEKPLLNFSTSDISAGSSGHTMSNPNSKDFKAPSIVGLLSDVNHNLSQAEPAIAEAHGEGKNAALPLPPGRKLAAPPPGPPPPPSKPPAPAPPPPPKVGRRPPNPPGPVKTSALGPHNRHFSTGGVSDASNESEAPKTKLKPFFWDKVLASPNHSMVWHEIKAGSFQFNEEMMETLFGYTPTDKNKNEHQKDLSSFDSPQFIQIIDPKKSQNLAILLRALNVTTEEVCDALKEGNELPAELIQTLLRMAPTSDEELKLRLYGGDISHLGPSERFLKVMVDIPFAFKRLESLLFVRTFPEEFFSAKESLANLEVACKELRNSRLFLKLLEAVLKTGNRMNDGTYRGGAQAFKLDTLLKLSDVKGTDGKTTLLHFVVQEIIRSEGIRAARRLRESRSMSSVKTEDLVEDSSNESEEYHRSLGLQVVSGLSNELQNVKKAAVIDNEFLSESVHKFGQALEKTKEFLNTEMKSVEGESEFCDALASFVEQCELDIKWLKDEEKRITALVKSTGDYFHGRAGRDEGSQLFVIVRDFLLMLDKACLDVKNSSKMPPSKAPRKESSASEKSSPSAKESPSESALDIHRRLFPAIRERQLDDDFSSDDGS
ncbi:hypothetical protein OROGR_012208 [Orobanche gracilis]